MSNIILGFLIATVVYGGVIFFAWRNNKKKFVEVLEVIDSALQNSTIDETLKAKFEALKAKFQ